MATGVGKAYQYNVEVYLRSLILLQCSENGTIMLLILPAPTVGPLIGACAAFKNPKAPQI